MSKDQSHTRIRPHPPLHLHACPSTGTLRAFLGSKQRMRPPISNSYWIEPGRFAAGEYPGAPTPQQTEEKLRVFLDAGIDHFIDLTESNEGLAPYAPTLAQLSGKLAVPASHQRLAIRDVNVPRTPAQMSATLDAIDGALSTGRKVYVHCWGAWGEQARPSDAG